jgi:uncharacterized protein
MNKSSAADPILMRFRAALTELYGGRLERVVFLKDLGDRWQEVDRIVPVVTDIIDDTGVVIHAMPYRAQAYQERTSLMREIRREGIDL